MSYPPSTSQGPTTSILYSLWVALNYALLLFRATLKQEGMADLALAATQKPKTPENAPLSLDLSERVNTPSPHVAARSTSLVLGGGCGLNHTHAHQASQGVSTSKVVRAGS
jgi:hypothetical protein